MNDSESVDEEVIELIQAIIEYLKNENANIRENIIKVKFFNCHKLLWEVILDISYIETCFLLIYLNFESFWNIFIFYVIEILRFFPLRTWFVASLTNPVIENSFWICSSD